MAPTVALANGSGYQTDPLACHGSRRSTADEDNGNGNGNNSNSNSNNNSRGEGRGSRND